MSVSNMQSPFAHYGVLSGQLFLYGQGRAAFESPIPESSSSSSLNSKKCILVGGLSDGLCPVPYTRDLEQACHQNNWSLVQPILSSSYTGFGHGSLDRDCDELQELMDFLMAHREAQEFCLLGHSTGCQDAIHFLAHAKEDLRSRLRVVALQAPVSDRESATVHPNPKADEYMAQAQKMVETDNAQEMMPRDSFWTPITAQRYLDLFAKGGTDDYFSSDYTDEELAKRLQHVGQHSKLQVLVASSGSDEYVPSDVDIPKLTERLVGAMNSKAAKDEPVAIGFCLETGNHNLSKGPDDGKRFVVKFAELLQNIK
ncbi:unnamed protein product [Cylindrotheca closterium]|uniref:Uncharacterized protein n=1 Tax=Cylindrotheca closterium TaxID=2856 RepID=A0AAD2GCB8_9STRA|nr:unnamed protein product [Cylindrotheca closterium]